MGGQTGLGQISDVAGVAAAPFTGGASLALPVGINAMDGLLGTNGRSGSMGNMLSSGVSAGGMDAMGASGLGAGLGASGLMGGGMNASAALPSILGGTGYGAQSVAGPGMLSGEVNSVAAMPENIASPLGATNSILNMAGNASHPGYSTPQNYGLPQESYPYQNSPAMGSIGVGIY